MATTELSHPRTRVIIIEDNRDAAAILRLLLDLYGYEMRVAYTGPEGVRLAQQWPPEVVLCDIGLPGLDGYGVATALRQHPATAQARLIAVTAYGSDTDRQRSQAGPIFASGSWGLPSSNNPSFSFIEQKTVTPGRSQW
jgi:CheY-like chemotaxis protein